MFRTTQLVDRAALPATFRTLTASSRMGKQDCWLSFGGNTVMAFTGNTVCRHVPPATSRHESRAVACWGEKVICQNPLHSNRHTVPVRNPHRCLNNPAYRNRVSCLFLGPMRHSPRRKSPGGTRNRRKCKTSINIVDCAIYLGAIIGPDSRHHVLR